MAALSGVRGVILESLGFGQRDPIGTADEVGGTASATVNGRRVRLLVQVGAGAGGVPLVINGDNTDFGIGAGNNGLAVDAMMRVYNPFLAQRERVRTPGVFKKGALALLAATDTTIWTPAAGKKFRLMLLVCSHSVASDILIKDNTAGTQFGELNLPAAGNPVVVPLPVNGYLSAAANNVLVVNAANAGTFTVWAVGTEE